MNKLLLLIPIILSLMLIVPVTIDAHQSGCHRWHSCPSDTGSYECGDKGYDNYCPSLTVQTDNKYYDEGDTVVISGNVKNKIGETPVQIVIFDEDKRYVHLAQIAVAQDNTFSNAVIAEGPLWKNGGEYTVKVHYKYKMAETTFSFTLKK